MGNHLSMILETLAKLGTTQMDILRKIKWLKIWNYDKKAKHVISFPIDIIGHDVLNAWITQKTLRWQVLIFFNDFHSVICFYYMCLTFVYSICLNYGFNFKNPWD
jgi:hypothetical protein